MGAMPDRDRLGGIMTDTQTPTESATAPVYSVPQERRIVTEIPGPKSRELHARRSKVVSAGVSAAQPG